MWFNILKTQETITDIGIDFELPEKVEPKNKRNNCNKQLEEYANKLKNMTNLMKERWEAGWPNHSEYFINSIPKKVAGQKAFQLDQELNRKYYPEGEIEEMVLWERHWFIYNPIPEEVACEAIRLLEETPSSDVDGWGYEPVQSEKNGWVILRYWNWNYQNNQNAIGVYNRTDPSAKIEIGWRNGEDTRVIENKDGSFVDTSGDKNIYHMSGYYEGRKEGMNWHK